MISLEHLADGSVSDRNFQKLMSLVLDTGGQSVGIRFGTGQITWPGGSPVSSTLTVSHGLGKAPTAVFAQGAGAHVDLFRVLSVSATDFTISARDTTGSPALGATVNFYWLVWG